MDFAKDRSQEFFFWGIWWIKVTVNFATHERGDAVNFHNSKVVWTLVALLAAIAAEVLQIAAGLLILLVKEIVHQLSGGQFVCVRTDFCCTNLLLAGSYGGRIQSAHAKKRSKNAARTSRCPSNSVKGNFRDF